MLEAFEAFERFPAFAGARSDVLRAEGGPRLGVDVVAAIESDLALTVAVLRRANRGKSAREQVSTVPHALERIGHDGLDQIVQGAPIFDFFEHTGDWGSAPEVHRLHALATQRAAARLAAAVEYRRVDELLVAALMHDIGKLVLTQAHPRYAEFQDPGQTPERRVEEERKFLGVDHALVGGVLARRWMLPRELAHAIERHHHPGETGLPGLVRLADMIARFEAGSPVNTQEMQVAAGDVGLDVDGLRALLAAEPSGQKRRSTERSPLTIGERRVFVELAKGWTYKEIAGSLNLSVSTVRTHLYNSYKKLGVADRAQAILLAKEHDWI